MGNINNYKYEIRHLRLPPCPRSRLRSRLRRPREEIHCRTRPPRMPRKQRTSRNQLHCPTMLRNQRTKGWTNRYPILQDEPADIPHYNTDATAGRPYATTGDRTTETGLGHYPNPPNHADFNNPNLESPAPYHDGASMT